MAEFGGYSANLGASSGDAASTGGNVTTENHNVAAAGVRADTGVVHWAVAVVVVALIVLGIGRGYLRNARIA